MLWLEKRGGKRNWETLQEAQSMVLSPSRALGKQNLTEENVIFGGNCWKRQLRAALNSHLLRENVNAHVEVSLQGWQFVDSRS